MRRLRSFVLLSAATIVGSFAAGALVDFALKQLRGVGVEDSIALPFLFTIRGPRPTPPEVVVISMDAASTAVLNLPARTRDWPRSLHARLIRHLTDQRVSAIAIDLDFARETAAAEDKALAQAIEKAGNVLLVERVDRITGPGFAGAQRRQPVPVLLEPARALVPAPVPAAAVVTQAWSFLAEPDGEEAATLPAAALHVHSQGSADTLLEALRNGTSQLQPGSKGASQSGWHDLRQAMHLLRSELRDNSATSRRVLEVVDASSRESLPDKNSQVLRALIRLYHDPGLFYLNYYGPPGTIRTVPYHEALNGVVQPALDLAGKAVFIGAGLSTIQSADQPDTYPTPFGERNGANFTGVEIQATAFANLLRGETLEPLGGFLSAACLVGFAILATAAAYFLPRRRSGVAALMLVCGYYASAQILFNVGGVLVPLAVPVLIQVPAAFIAVHFARKPFLKKVVSGPCLVVDVAGSTPLAGTLAPDRLRELLDSYWLAIGEAARKSSAIVQAPQVGDSFVCFWPASPPDDRLIRHRSCLAALEISDVVARFNAARPDTPLPARLGLHAGRFSVCRDLDGDRCTLVGHAVNVATRFEELGKTLLGGVGRLGAPVLTSSEVIEGLNGLLTRYVGRHGLDGVGRIAVYELVGESDCVPQPEVDFCRRFAAALRLYEDGRLNEALTAFGDLASSGKDRPSSYFAAECESRLAQVDVRTGARA